MLCLKTIFNYFLIFILENTNLKKSIQDRIPTPHTLKTFKVNQNNVVVPQNNPTNLIKTKSSENKIKSIKKPKEKAIEVENLESTQNNSTVRRSSRLAKKPSKNYKC